MGKVRQFAAHLHAGVRPEARHELDAWLTPAQLRLFDSMHPADRRHGLDVVWRLRADGWNEPAVLLAGLFHDAGKGRTGLWPRVAWSLGEHYGRLPRWILGFVPGFGPALERLDRHPDTSAELALLAGCPARTAELIRCQSRPLDDAGRALHRADEAS